MNTIYLLMADSVIYGVYTHHATAKSYAKNYEHVPNLEVIILHPTEKNVLFDMEDYLDTEDIEEWDDSEVTE